MVNEPVLGSNRVSRRAALSIASRLLHLPRQTPARPDRWKHGLFRTLRLRGRHGDGRIARAGCPAGRDSPESVLHRQHSVHFICISSHVPRARSQSALVIGLLEGEDGEYVPGVPVCGVVPADALGVVTPLLVPGLPLLV